MDVIRYLCSCNQLQLWRGKIIKWALSSSSTLKVIKLQANQTQVFHTQAEVSSMFNSLLLVGALPINLKTNSDWNAFFIAKSTWNIEHKKMLPQFNKINANKVLIFLSDDLTFDEWRKISHSSKSDSNDYILLRFLLEISFKTWAITNLTTLSQWNYFIKPCAKLLTVAFGTIQWRLEIFINCVVYPSRRAGRWSPNA